MLRAYGDGTLFGEPYGEGPVRVIWLHGWGRRAQDFAAAANDVALKGIASVALDLPGFGSSPPPAAAGGARAYAEMVLPTLREIGDGPFVVVGHSFGGTVACVLAANHPELVRALVLTGAPLLRVPSTKSSPVAVPPASLASRAPASSTTSAWNRRARSTGRATTAMPRA